MFASLVCLAALAAPAAQETKLEIVDPRPTYGHLGATRPKEGALPGDTVHFMFGIKGLKFNDKGEAAYSLMYEVRDSKGETVYKYGPVNSVAHNSFGGDYLPVASSLEVPLTAPPGTATMKVTVVDRNSKQKVVFKTEGKILPKDFGLVRVGTFADSKANVPTPPICGLGETIHTNFSVVSFQRDKKTGQPNIHFSMNIVDENGNSTTVKPLEGEITSGIPKSFTHVPAGFGLTVNRTGNFRIDITATDQISGKKSKVSIPLKVLEVQ